jgi:D-beta-D-heptose 7-phosphate kinase/D-beta-D-heptose 1-phosphate adenosyltransferase
MRLDRGQAEDLLERIKGHPVVVLGDLMLDEYLFGEVDRISPEAPVPIVRVSRERAVLGGAANVAANLKSVGAEPVLVGTLRQDNAGIRLQALLRTMEIRADRIVVDPARPTIIKTRVIGQQQQMLRIDREEPGESAPQVGEALCASLAEALERATALIVSDYAKGAVSGPVMDRVRDLCRERGVPWIVDPKPGHRAMYAGAPLMTPNTKELAELTGLPARTDPDLVAAGQALMASLGLQGLLVTRSEKGMALFAADDRHRAPWMIPTEAREVFDVSGAGDTVIGVFAAAVAAGADWKDAAMLANAAAGVVVGKMGTATATPAEILRHYQDQEAL